MALDLNTENEYIEIDGQKIPVYREFFGPYIQQMPLLLQSGREAMSVADVLIRRYAVQDAPEKVKADWHDRYFCTSVGNNQFRDGSAKLVLHDDYLIRVNSDTPLREGAAVLSDEQWESLTGKNVLYISPERVKEIDRQRYTKESIRDSPEWNFLFEGNSSTLKTVTEYLFSEMERRFQYTEALEICFDHVQDVHTNRSAYVIVLENRSRLNGWRNLVNVNCRLVGFLAPEALMHQAKLLEEMLQLHSHKHTP